VIRELSELTLEELWELFPIFLVDHNDAWATSYELEKKRVAEIIGAHSGFRLNHIGSTAIKGIKAKPIIDIFLEVEAERFARAISAIKASGQWTAMSESQGRVSFNKGYTRHGFAKRVFHLHVRCRGDCDELYFRDYLQAHREIALAYEALKLSLWKEFEHDRDAYTRAKTDFITRCTALAKSEFPNRY